MTVVKSLVKAEHDVKIENLSSGAAAAQTDVTRRCKLKSSLNRSTDMVLHLSLLFWSIDFVALFKNRINSLLL